MSGWVLTKGLQNLRSQVDAAFPHRSKASDGTIGDTAHQAETSGHNPDDTAGARPEWNGDTDSIPEVRAWDCTSDFGDGVDAQDVVDHLRALPGLSTVLRYMIYNRKIYRAANGWRAESYTGASAHTEHIHFTGAYSQAADDNMHFDYRLEEIPVALTDADWTRLETLVRTEVGKVAAQVWGYQLEDPASTTTPKARKSAAAFQRWVDVIADGVVKRTTAAILPAVEALKDTK